MKTEKDKMLGGELYDPQDPQLTAARRRARLLLKELNDSRDDPREERTGLIRELIPDCGKGVWIEPPFFCDYGSNISLGDQVYFNFNCVVLDVAPVRIGARVLFGPAVQIYAATHPLSAAPDWSSAVPSRSATTPGSAAAPSSAPACASARGR